MSNVKPNHPMPPEDSVDVFSLSATGEFGRSIGELFVGLGAGLPVPGPAEPDGVVVLSVASPSANPVTLTSDPPVGLLVGFPVLGLELSVFGGGFPVFGAGFGEFGLGRGVSLLPNVKRFGGAPGVARVVGGTGGGSLFDVVDVFLLESLGVEVFLFGPASFLGAAVFFWLVGGAPAFLGDGAAFFVEAECFAG